MWPQDRIIQVNYSLSHAAAILSCYSMQSISVPKFYTFFENLLQFITMTVVSGASVDPPHKWLSISGSQKYNIRADTSGIMCKPNLIEIRSAVLEWNHADGRQT
jgi:hypothetical protein